jgi:hypothetical protein
MKKIITILLFVFMPFSAFAITVSQNSFIQNDPTDGGDNFDIICDGNWGGLIQKHYFIEYLPNGDKATSYGGFYGSCDQLGGNILGADGQNLSNGGAVQPNFDGNMPTGIYHIVEYFVSAGSSDFIENYGENLGGTVDNSPGNYSDRQNNTGSIYFVGDVAISLTAAVTPTTGGGPLFHIGNVSGAGTAGNNTATDLMAAVGSVSVNTFDSVWPYLVLSIGVFVGFYIIEQLAMFLGQRSTEKIKKSKK